MIMLKAIIVKRRGHVNLEIKDSDGTNILYMSWYKTDSETIDNDVNELIKKLHECRVDLGYND